MLAGNSNISSETQEVNATNRWSMPSSKFIKKVVILTSVTVGSGMGYLLNKILDEETKNIPGSNFIPEIDNPYGAIKGIISGAIIGLLFSVSACNCFLLTDCLAKDEVNNENSPLIDNSLTSDSDDSSIEKESTVKYRSTAFIPPFATVKIEMDDMASSYQAASLSSKATWL